MSRTQTIVNVVFFMIVDSRVMSFEEAIIFIWICSKINVIPLLLQSANTLNKQELLSLIWFHK